MQYLTNLWDALDFGSLESILLRVAAVFLCLTIHETCHGLAAYALGDPTAKRAHRLSLNPLRHIDWLGLIMMVAAGFGWAKPVPVNPNYFKKPKQGMALTALAGPASNFLLAFLLLLAARLTAEHAVAAGALNETWFMFLLNTASLSVGLGLFNLVPIPPLDGSKVLAVLLPDRAYNWLMRYERFGMLVLLAVISVGIGSNALDSAIRWVFMLLCKAVGLVCGVELDDPIYKLEKVVQTKGDEPLEDFEGPLDLILYLLSKNKIEIQDIPIALILEQYQAYLEKRKQMDLEVASEFITMAAQLMFIKTRMLLNLEDEEAQSEMDALIKSLEERKRGEAYARVRMLSERLAPLGEFGRSILTRPPEPMERGKIFEYDQEPADLILAMEEVTDRRGAPEAPPLKAFDEIVKREPYPVENKAREIIRRLRLGGITRFLLLFRGSKTRSELVATFMAVLELCRNNLIRLAGADRDCTVVCEDGVTEDTTYDLT